MSPIKFPTKRIFPNFHILKINRMTSFCNLFMERHTSQTIPRHGLHQEPGHSVMSRVDYCNAEPPYLHLATSEM